MHERDILLATLEIVHPVEREAFLAQVCGDDAQLRSRVDALLRASQVQDGFLESPAADTELLSRETDPLRQPCAAEAELSLDFLQPADDPSALGRLGPYPVTEVIGRGGMGVVLKARDTKLNRVVAIKVLAPELASNPTARKRFQREAHAAAAVVHQHVVTIHAVDEDRVPYLVMEYIDGQSLKEKIDREGNLKLVEILRIGQQVASGLAAAHAHGLMHRDVKPANILLENGIERVRITDFGLARAVDDVGMTRTGEVAGTPEYMSPEQAQGLPMDGRSDLFSFGCVLYAMCTGRPPFRAETVFATARRVCEDAPRPIREINPEIPDWLVEIIDRLLAKKPDERFQTAAEVADLLAQRLAEHQHPSLVKSAEKNLPLSQIPNPKSQIRFRLWAIAAAAVVLLVVGISLTEATGVTQVVPTVLRIVTGEGTLVVETDPDVQVTIAGNGDVTFTLAGGQSIRVPTGPYRVKATKDGKPIPLEKDLVTITRGDKQVVRVRLERDADIADAPKVEKGAFVLLGGAGVAERKFDTLASAVLAARDGDIIEIRGNGPFDTPPVTIRRPLVVRAGNGFAPVIRLRAGETGHVLHCSAPLVLEGLEIRYRLEELQGELGERDLVQRDAVIRCNGASLAIANCRLIGDGKRSILQSWPSPSARVVNSELLNSAWAAVSWGNTQGRLEIDNCIVAAPGAGTLIESGSDKFSISVSQSTSLTGWHTLGIRRKLALAVSHEPESSRTPPMSIELVGNVLDAPDPVVNVTPVDAFIAATFDLSREERNLLAPQLFAWREQYNLYRHGSDFCAWVVKKPGGRESRSATTRDEWTALFQLGNTHSRQGQPRFRGGDLRTRMAADPLSLSPNDFRLQPDSPGYHAGPDGKDLGADVDLVGPGPAYERWKKTAEYQQWLKDTGQHRTAAPSSEQGAFVRLSGKGVPERKFDTLAQAVQAASDGDTIEVRGNGPFETSPITSTQPLVIRAGSGFQPVIRLRSGESGDLINATAALRIEGLELQNPPSEPGVFLRSKGAPLAVANCRFVGDGRRDAVACVASPVAEVRNCEMLNIAWSGVHWMPRAEAQLRIDNCVLAAPQGGRCVWVSLPAEPQGVSLRLTRTTSITPWPPLGIGWESTVSLPGKTPDPARPLPHIELAANSFDAPLPVVSLFPLGRALDAIGELSPQQRKALVPDLLTWRERYNLYPPGTGFANWTLKHSEESYRYEAVDRSEWTAYWSLQETNALEGKPEFKGGNVGGRVAADARSLTPDDFRLREDSPGYQAGPDGKDLGADVDLVGPGPAYERWKKTPEYQQWLKDTGQLRAEVPQPEAGAFVLLGGKGVAERKFDTLAEAVLGSSDGDTIEVRGNGPFVSDGVTIRHPLVIRAGAGFAPSIALSKASADKNIPLVTALDALVLEGLELRRTGGAIENVEGRVPKLIDAWDPTEVHIANSRLIFNSDPLVRRRGSLIGTRAAVLTVRNCELSGNVEFAGQWHYAAGGRCAVENCVIASGSFGFLNHGPDLKDVSIRVRGNTLVGHCLNLTLLSNPSLLVAGEATPPVRLEWSGNVALWDVTTRGFLFFHQFQFKEPFSAAEVEALLPRLVRLDEKQNVYRPGGPLLRLAVDWQPLTGKRAQDLADWDRFWGEQKTGSVEGEVRLQGGDLITRARSAPDKLTAEDFRLRPDSAGYRAGADGKDLGADVDLVGPGAAYERWKKTPEYQQWLEETGQSEKPE